MAKTTKSPKQRSKPTPSSPHPALKLRHKLSGHTDLIYRMALSPDGRTLASPSKDNTVRLWDVESGRLLRTFSHGGGVCVAWSPDGTRLAASMGRANAVYLWEAKTGRQIQILEGSAHWEIRSLAWSPDGRILAGGSENVIQIWDTVGEDKPRKLGGRLTDVEAVAWSPNGKWLCSGSWGGSGRLWETDTWDTHRILAQKNGVRCLTWSADGQHIIMGSGDNTVSIWGRQSKQKKNVLEGHINGVEFVAFIDDGCFLVSLDYSGMMMIWRADTWTEVLRVRDIGAQNPCSLGVHPTLPVIVACTSTRKDINVWDIDLPLLRAVKPISQTIHYVNAKAVLLGESGVGKSGLGHRIADRRFRKTQSTHGAQFWHFPSERLPALPANVQAELTLWDLAGQPEYRLTHQLFLDDTDAALLLFDCSDPNDPFRGVPYWAKVLKKHAPEHAKKFLVSARCDVSPVTVDRPTINRVLATYGLDEYFKTSAKTGESVDILFQHLMSEIPWDRLPRTSTPRLFQVVREFLLERKQAGENLISMAEVQRGAAEFFNEDGATQAELDTVIRLLQSRGLVHRLEPRPGKAWVVLKPEKINQYGASIIQAARNHPQGIGAVPDRDVLTANIPFTGFERLPHAEEALVLEGTLELLIRHDLGFREMGNLVFPSQINITRQPPDEGLPRTEVAYQFSGSIETTYASLVVRLSYTDYFRREDQWKYAVEFSRRDDRLGFSMQQIEEGTGELEIYFQPGISEFDRVTFIRFVTDHLRAKGIDMHEQIRLYCPNCSKEVTNREAIEARIRDGKLDIPCLFCDMAIVIPKSVEEIYSRVPSLGRKQKQLAKTVEKRTKAEVKRFRADQHQYMDVEDQQIHILHLSDLHFTNNTVAGVWKTQLETDLKQELGIRRLEYLVVSGDVANYSTEKEYDAAFAMVDGLVKRFGLDASRVVIVPGNHDVNWELSEEAYPFVPKRKLPTPLLEDRCIPAGEAGALLRNDPLYRERFRHFNTYFYRRVYSGQDYPLDYADQSLFIERPEDRILFLGLNSSWQLDHHFPARSSIHMPALSQALDRLQDDKYNGWLKVAVWHHPIAGKEMMNDDFMQQLAVHGFQICMHGHIHEASEGFHKYDERRQIHVIGAGTFGAPAHEQVTGIPLQYNLLSFDPQTGDMTVNTRKKERPEGAWSADARWQDKNNPKPWYRFNVQNYVVDQKRKR